MPLAPQRSEPHVLKVSANVCFHVVSTQAAPQAEVTDLASVSEQECSECPGWQNESLFSLYST